MRHRMDMEDPFTGAGQPLSAEDCSERRQTQGRRDGLLELPEGQGNDWVTGGWVWQRVGLARDALHVPHGCAGRGAEHLCCKLDHQRRVSVEQMRAREERSMGGG